MSHSNRPLGSTMRHTSMPHVGSNSNASPTVVARINEKRIELENYKELRDLSAQLAAQMEALEEKLSTIANGAEAVATVLSNWQDVLKAIKMASMKMPKPKEDDADQNDEDASTALRLPQTLIRIPFPPSSHQTTVVP